MANINRNYINTESKKVTDEIISLFNSFDSYRKQWEDDAVENYKKYIGYKEEYDDNKANLHIPRTYEIIDTIRARIVNSFFNKKPYIEFVPLPDNQKRDSLERAEEKAEVASGLIDEQLEKNNIVTKYYDYVTSMLIFPSAIMGVGWKYEEETIRRKVPVPEWTNPQYGFPQMTGNYVYEERQRQEVKWDDNKITNIDFFDFWPDPKATDLEDCRGVFHREIITFEELMKRLDFLEYLDEGIIYPADYDELAEEMPNQAEEGRNTRMSEVGKSANMGKDYSSSEDQGLKNKTKFEVLHYWENDRHAMLINRNKVIYDGPSPYWRHKKIPFICESYERLPNEFYGKAAVDIIADLQEEENAIHNQRSDNVNMILNKMWKVRKGADIDESELVSRPHGIVYVDNPEDVQPFEMGDVAASSFQQQNIVAQNMENALGATPVMRGAEGRGDKTATEVQRQTNASGIRFNVKIQLFNNTGIKRMVSMMDANNQQFIDHQRTIKIGNEEAIRWRDVSPGELIGNFDYRPASQGIDPAANKQVRREQLSQMMSFLMEAGIPFVDYHKLIKEWLESFDITNAQKFITPRDQYLQQQKAQIQQQRAQMQQQQNTRDQATQADQQRAAMQGQGQGMNEHQNVERQRPGGHIR